MRKILFLLLALFCTSLLSAQGFIQLRYYFNNNAENFQLVSLASMEELDQNFQVDVSGLPQGVHTLFLDLLNQDGVWTHYDQVMIQIFGGTNMYTLNSYEYFFDVDPGFGNGIQVAISGDSYDAEIPLNLSGLDVGIHRVFFRFKDGANQWTHYHSQMIQITKGGMDEVVRLEYFFDNDPGYGLGNEIFFSSSSILDVEEEIVIPASLGLGQHILYSRILDSSGQWSHYGQDTVVVCEIQQPELTQHGNACSGDTITLFVEGDYSSYEWSNGSTEDSIWVTTSGSYTLTVTDEDCSATVETEFIFIEIPIPVISVNGNILSVFDGSYDYVWSIDGIEISNNNQSSWEGTNSGVVQVTVSSGDCFEVSEPINFIHNGVSISKTKLFDVFPNPTSGIVHLISNEPGILELYDLTGRILLRYETSSENGFIDLENFEGQTFVLKFISESDLVYSHRVMKL